MSEQQAIEKILASTKHIAVVGFSSKEERAGFYVPEYLQAQGYRIFPVNPKLANGLGKTAFSDLASITERVDLVLIFQRSENVPPFVKQAIEIEATAVWMQLGIYNEEAAAQARASGLDVVMDACMLVEHRRWQSAKLSTKVSV